MVILMFHLEYNFLKIQLSYLKGVSESLTMSTIQASDKNVELEKTL